MQMHMDMDIACESKRVCLCFCSEFAVVNGSKLEHAYGGWRGENAANM